MSWQAPTIGTRPVAVLGGGVLGRRIACSYAAGGYNVTIQDPSAEARADATDFINSKKEEFATYTKHPTQGQFGSFSAYEDIESAVREAWLVIEAVPEKLELKIDVFELLDNCAPKDCVLGSNSSSYRTSLMLDRVSADRRKLICNIHYTMPMDIRTVELMTDGETEEAIFPFLTTVLERFIFHRLWAAAKHETLMILAEDVSDAEQVDKLWKHMFQSNVAPCELMDQIGLGTAALIDDDYTEERDLNGGLTVECLRENHIAERGLGKKSALGGYTVAASCYV